MPKCTVCSKETTKLCGRCQNVAFCSVGCQKASWREHRKFCTKSGPKTQTKSNPMASKSKEEISKLLGVLNSAISTQNVGEKAESYLQPAAGSSSSVGPKKKVDVNESDENGNCPLMGACQGGHLAIVKLLLERGANIDQEDRHGQTSLIKAAENGHLEVVKFLLDNKCNVNHRDTEGNTALILAAQKGHLEVSQLLGSRGGRM